MSGRQAERRPRHGPAARAGGAELATGETASAASGASGGGAGWRSTEDGAGRWVAHQRLRRESTQRGDGKSTRTTGRRALAVGGGLRQLVLLDLHAVRRAALQPVKEPIPPQRYYAAALERGALGKQRDAKVALGDTREESGGCHGHHHHDASIITIITTTITLHHEPSPAPAPAIKDA